MYLYDLEQNKYFIVFITIKYFTSSSRHLVKSYLKKKYFVAKTKKRLLSQREFLRLFNFFFHVL